MSPSRHPMTVVLSMYFSMFAGMGVSIEFAATGCVLSIYLALAAYWLIHRHECRACGQRSALEHGETTLVPRESRLAADQEVELWRSKYCGHNFLREVHKPGEGFGGG